MRGTGILIETILGVGNAGALTNTKRGWSARYQETKWPYWERKRESVVQITKKLKNKAAFQVVQDLWANQNTIHLSVIGDTH